MVYLQIDKTNYGNGNIDKLNTYAGNKNNKIFILFFMEGCTPCNETKPEWAKLKNVLSKDFINRNDIVIASIDHELFDKLKHFKTQPTKFPTILYVTNSGAKEENFGDAVEMKNAERTIDNFVKWIKIKTGEDNITSSETSSIGGKSRKRNKSRKRWTRKYKKSINCKKPRGFSQKQYCKYGRK